MLLMWLEKCKTLITLDHKPGIVGRDGTVTYRLESNNSPNSAKIMGRSRSMINRFEQGLIMKTGRLMTCDDFPSKATAVS